MIKWVCKNMAEVKYFKFPTYEEWVKNKKNFKTKVGEYYCEIEVTYWGESVYGVGIAISTSHIPHNFYVKRIYSEGFRVERNLDTGEWNEKELREWYNNIVIDCNNFWKEYINKTYLCES